jgi:aspartate beta-hydroxylase
VQPGARRAPRTAALIRELGPQVTTMVSGSVYFSLMSAGARLRPHCGPTNSRLRVHLALSARRGMCGMRVGNESRLWREGEVWVFDDSFEHEVRRRRGVKVAKGRGVKVVNGRVVKVG